MELFTEFLKVLFAPGYIALGFMIVFGVTFTSITFILAWKENRTAKPFSKIRKDELRNRHLL
ncbi:MAG: hypothetical protein QNI92_08190 [Desulfobacterales bacterium]|nr:hypothetical protein [Desulfobacterales bacterium]